MQDGYAGHPDGVLALAAIESDPSRGCPVGGSPTDVSKTFVYETPAADFGDRL